MNSVGPTGRLRRLTHEHGALLPCGRRSRFSQRCENEHEIAADAASQKSVSPRRETGRENATGQKPVYQSRQTDRENDTRNGAKLTVVFLTL